MYNTEAWQRPKTVKRYLHPSLCERLFAFWVEGKITMSEIGFPRDISTDAINKNRTCSGIFAVHTHRARILDYKNAKVRVPEDGTPVHGLTATFGGFEMDMEAFCDTARKATCFVKITVTNKAPYKAKERFGLVVRTGKEQVLAYSAPDGYASHAPEVASFTALPCTFIKSGNILRDGSTFIGIQSKIGLEFDAERGILWANEALESGACYEIYLSFGIGENACVDFDYEEKKAQTVAYWQKQLQRLQLPAGIEQDAEKMRLVQNFTVQILQCYARYVGKDCVVPRQGALQPFVWIWDQYPVLEAITRLGDFKEFYRGAISLYFDEMQKESGEVCTFGENWASDTACALLSLCTCCLNASDRELWETYRTHAARAFAWICRKRRETVGMPDVVEGLFPPMRGTDAAQVFQNWKTDVWNLFAIDEYARCAARFGNDADAIRAEYDAYLAVMRKTFADATAAQKDSDALHIPLMPRGDDRQLLEEEFYFYLMHGVFLYSDVIGEKDFWRVLRAMEREGISSGNGLYGHMRYSNGNTHVWYTTAPELYIFRAFRKRGELALAKQILDAELRYAVSEEYCVCERVCDNDPWFVPWMPNASGMGRLLTMLLDSCEDAQ